MRVFLNLLILMTNFVRGNQELNLLNYKDSIEARWKALSRKRTFSLAAPRRNMIPPKITSSLIWDRARKFRNKWILTVASKYRWTRVRRTWWTTPKFANHPRSSKTTSCRKIYSKNIARRTLKWIVWLLVNLCSPETQNRHQILKSNLQSPPFWLMKQKVSNSVKRVRSQTRRVSQDLSRHSTQMRPITLIKLEMLSKRKSFLSPMTTQNRKRMKIRRRAQKTSTLYFRTIGRNSTRWAIVWGKSLGTHQ